jgi:hypothetical protein
MHVLKMPEMTDKMDQFALRIKKLPGRLREYVFIDIDTHVAMTREVDACAQDARDDRQDGPVRSTHQEAARTTPRVRIESDNKCIKVRYIEYRVYYI